MPRRNTGQRAWYQPGELVEEAHFGRGVVQRAGDTEVPIRFEDGTIRTFDPARAQIRKVPQWEGTRISPSWTEVRDPARFVPSLTPGELALAEFFDTHLPTGWRVYIRPHLDGDLPSLALLHPDHGAMLWDVVEPRGAPLTTSNVDPGALDALDALVASMRRSPVERLEAVRRRLFSDRATTLGEAWDRDHRLIGMVKVGLYFPHHGSGQIAHLTVDHPWATFICRGELGARPVHAYVPDLQRHVDLDGEGLRELDRLFASYWETPPEIGTVELRGTQRELAKARPGAQTMIRGVAGSGKSLVLMHRAINIAQQGRRVLVLTFNRTLTNYLADLRRQIPGRYIQERILIRHFHGLCVDLARVHSWPYLGGGNLDGHDGQAEPAESWDEVDDEPPQSFFDVVLPQSALASIGLGVPDQYHFDALLIDEAQDISTAYLEVASALLDPPRPEIVAVSDPAQKIYQRPSAWDDDAVLARFGAPKALATGYRLSRPNAEAASRFASMWSLPTPPIGEPDDGLGMPSGSLSWHRAGDDTAAAAAAFRVVRTWMASPDGRPGGIAVLVPSKPFGAAFVQLLADHSIAANHVFAVKATGAPMDGPPTQPADTSTRRGRVRFEQSMKKSFTPSDQRLKVSTVHSFKGWEADRVLCVLPPPATSSEDHLAFVYVAITRSLGDLVVIGTSDELRLGDVLPGRLPVDDSDQEVAHHFAGLLLDAEQDLARTSRQRARDQREVAA